MLYLPMDSSAYPACNFLHLFLFILFATRRLCLLLKCGLYYKHFYVPGVVICYHNEGFNLQHTIRL